MSISDINTNRAMKSEETSFLGNHVEIKADKAKGKSKMTLFAKKVWQCTTSAAALISFSAWAISHLTEVKGPSAVWAISGVALMVLLGIRLLAEVKPYLPEPVRFLVNCILTVFVEAAALVCLARRFFNRLVNEEKQVLADKMEGVRSTGQRIDIKRIVIVGHGFLHNSSASYWLKRRFEEEHDVKVFSMDYAGPFKSIQEFVKIVQEEVLSIAKVYKCDSWSFVGHSMGGLVLSEYITTYAELDSIQVKNMITLGTPSQGTWLALLLSTLGSKSCQEMLPGSAFIKALNARVKECAEKYYFYNFTSATDEFILPTRNGRFEGQSESRVTHYEQMGHGQFLVDEEVINAIHEIIFQEPQAKSEVAP